MIKSIKASDRRINQDWPKHGYYVDLYWSKCIDAKTKTVNTTVGPFPESDTKILINFLNLLEKMKECKKPNDYQKLPEYNKWFHLNSYSTPLGLCIETPYDDMDTEKEYRFCNYSVYYHDGISITPYSADIEKTEQTDDMNDPDEIKSQFLQFLPQYHFERSMFVNTFNDIFGEFTQDLDDMCIDNHHTESFTLDYDDDEYYIIHRPSGTIINWYKHRGRTNTCNKPGFGIDDLQEMLTLLKMEL